MSALGTSGNTGLDLRFDDDWGILVQSVDPLPGQPGLAPGPQQALAWSAKA